MYINNILYDIAVYVNALVRWAGGVIGPTADAEKHLWQHVIHVLRHLQNGGSLASV
jgi:hypothetical protein